MTRQDEDREGAKPYKTYKARRPRRTQVDDELAGARPARERPPANGRGASGSAPDYPRQSDKAYRTYGPAPENGRKAGKKKAKQGCRPGSAPPAPLPLVVHPRRRLRRAGHRRRGLHGPRLARVPEVRPGRRQGQQARRQEDPRPALRGRRVDLAQRHDRRPVRPRRRRAPGALRHHHAHALRRPDPHHQPALDPPRHAGQRRRLRAAEDHPGDVVRRAVTGAQDRQGLHRHPHQPHHGRGLPGVPAAGQLRRRHRHLRAADGDHRGGPRRRRLHPARRHLQEGHAPLRRQERDAVRAHPQGVRWQVATSPAPRASRPSSRRSRRSSCSPATSPSCRRSASTS